ncbi:hypothetical protein V8E53_009837 [Lactarius tabidus]
MDPRALTARILTTFQKLGSAHSSCSLTRTPITQLRLRTYPPAPTSTELCNKVSRGSRRKQIPPELCSAFGLVSQGNIGVFVPFNDTTPVVKSSSTYRKRQDPGTVGTGVTDSQVLSAYQSWFQAGFNSGVSGMTQYQDSEQNLTPAPGTVVQSSNGQGTVGSSPNDGYGGLGTDESDLQQTILSASQNFT